MCVYVCVCKYSNKLINKYIYIYIYIYTCVYTYIYVYIHRIHVPWAHQKLLMVADTTDATFQSAKAEAELHEDVVVLASSHVDWVAWREKSSRQVLEPCRSKEPKVGQVHMGVSKNQGP